MSTNIDGENGSLEDIGTALPDNLSPLIYRQGAAIFREGESSGLAYIIERGQVKISKEGNGEESVVAILGPGELIGEMSPIDSKNRSASATALTETEVIPISREQLEYAIDNADPLIQLLLRVIIERLRNTDPNESEDPDRLQIFDKDLGQRSLDAVRGRAIRQIRLETEIRDAFARRELDLYYQPIVRLSDNRLAGFEALIRWLSPERGVVGPDQFISVAEDSGVIVPIGLWVIEHACHILKRFQSIRKKHFPDEPPIFMSANVSARQLRKSASVEAIIDTIRRSGIDPQGLKIEITEGLLLDDPDAAIIAFNQLKELGVTIALDDFGTGYSSLSYLHRFPLDTLKIDRSFVSSMLASRESMAVVRTITRLARDLNLTCVSEGIEDPFELATLKEFGCDYGQGYLYSPPVSINEAEQLLAEEFLSFPSADIAAQSAD